MKLLLLTALLGVAYVAAECPEACNGHGFCGEYDKCSCYRNWQGNSCADRTCPFDIAFVDIPHGDLNMDGKLDDEITLYGAQINDVYAFEVYPTDGYQVNRNSDDDSADDVMYTTTSAREKAASFYDMAEDGHFYAECSNKGMCDRKSGQCDCFDGYSGAACRRVACPNDCSGHGTCETIQETSISDTTSYSYQLWDRYKTQVCNCDPGYFGIDCAQRNCPFGDDPLSTDQHDEIQWLTLRTHGDGTAGPIDAKLANGDTGGDSAYFLGDLDIEGTFTLGYKDEFGEYWNTSPIKAESYSVAYEAELASALEKALEGIPNGVFEDVTVEVWPIQLPLPGLYTCVNADAGGTGTCTLTADTTHKVALTDDVVGGEDAYRYGVSNCKNGADFLALTGVSIGRDGGTADDGVLTGGGASASCSDGSSTTKADCATASATWTSMEDYTSICRYDMNGFRAKITFNSNPGNLPALTCDAREVTTPEHKDSNDPDTDISCTAADTLDFSLGAFGADVGSSIGGGNGGRLLTNMDLKEMMTHGDRITTNSAVYTIAGPIYAPTTDGNANGGALAAIIVEEETTADVAISARNAPNGKWFGEGTSERVECSHRGLCNHDEGLCECFTGYTHDDCSRQDALNA